MSALGLQVSAPQQIPALPLKNPKFVKYFKVLTRTYFDYQDPINKI